jgi:hypothetical protein
MSGALVNEENSPSNNRANNKNFDFFWPTQFPRDMWRMQQSFLSGRRVFWV